MRTSSATFGSLVGSAMNALTLLVSGAGVLAGCTGLVTPHVATDGEVFLSPTVAGLRDAALAASAAHDIPCSRAAVSVHRLAGGFYAVEGCGRRVTYFQQFDMVTDRYVYVLVAAVAMPK